MTQVPAHDEPHLGGEALGIPAAHPLAQDQVVTTPEAATVTDT